MHSLPEYDRLDATDLAELVRKKQVSAAELIAAAIERIEAANPRVNAVVNKLYDRARQHALGPLPNGPFTGVPFLIKDLLAVEGGVCTTNASRFFLGSVPPYDSELVRRFKAAGLLIVGKTNTPEMGLLPVTEPRLFGPTRNPWNTAHSPGGSSGGSAAAVAAGMVPMAHGNDGGGSIRIPASCCGLFGLKPTRGRNPLGPYVGEGWHGIVVEHAVTRTVRDSAALLDATQGPDPGAPYVAPAPERPFRDEVGRDPGKLRIAFTTGSLLGRRVHPDCAAAVKHAAGLCEKLGHTVEEAAPPLDRRTITKAYLTLVAAELASDIELGGRALKKKPRHDEFEQGTWMLAQIGKKFRADELSMAVHAVRSFGREQAGWFARYDALLTATLSAPPLRIGALDQKPIEKAVMSILRLVPSGLVMRRLLDQIADQAFEFAAFTATSNLTGAPAMSVPLFWNGQGLPIGVHFAGRYGEEGKLFRLAGQLEAAQPWAQRRPPAA
jgi:amidase